MPVLAVLLWVPVAAVKVLLVALGFVVVPVMLATGWRWRLYWTTRGIPTLWEMCVRNPVDGFKFLVRHPAAYHERGNVERIESPWLVARDNRWGWRFRRAGVLASLRVVWLYGDTRYGELYVGWKLGSEPPALDFALSLRPLAWVGQ